MSIAHEETPLHKISDWSLGLGVILALLGVLSIASPWATSVVVNALVGGSLVAAGISQLGMTLGTFTWRGFWLTLLCGVLSIIAGLAMLVIPVEGVHALVTFLGLVILFEAGAKLMAAFSVPRDYPWGWLLGDGIITALLGGMLLVSPPDKAGVYLGVLIGINLLTSGIAFLAAGMSLRRVSR
jgi:uncharacterized membrane protein HdeD (DUF308 family)